MNYACKMFNRCIIFFLDRDYSPQGFWHGRRPTIGNITPFGTLENTRRQHRKHKLAPRRDTSIILGLAIGFPRGCLRERHPTTGQIIVHEAINGYRPVVFGENEPIR